MKRLVLALLLAASPAAAATDEVYPIYARGDYEQAARVGEASHSAQGLATAARAVLAEAMLRPQPCLDCLKRAENLARQAIGRDPHCADGQIWLAVALGYQARITGPVKARLANTPKQSRTALDQAVADDPANPFAVSALGGWHIEIVRGGGAFLARTLYGATEEEGLRLFDRAVKLDPGNVAVHYQVALSLLGFKPEKYRARIQGELRAAITGQPDTVYERAMQERANDLLGLVNHGPDEALTARVRRYQGYPD